MYDRYPISIYFQNSNFSGPFTPSLKFVPQTVKRKKMWSTSNYFVPFHGSWQRKNERERLLQTNEPALHLFFPFVIQQRGVQRFVRGIQLDSVDRWRGNAGDMDAPSPAKTGGRQLLLREKRRRRGKMRIEALSVFKWYIVCTESWAAAGEGLDEDSAKGRSRGSMGMNNNFGRSKYIYYCGVMELCIFCVEGATTLFVWW